MATEPAVALPSAQQLRDALVRFAYTIAGITNARAQRHPHPWMGQVAVWLASHLNENLSPDDLAETVEDYSGLSAPALVVLYLEISYINVLFEQAAQSVGSPAEIDNNTRQFAGSVAADPHNQEDVARLDVVYGSIESLVRKLPWWAQKIFNVAMEILKLSAGNSG